MTHRYPTTFWNKIKNLVKYENNTVIRTVMTYINNAIMMYGLGHLAQHPSLDQIYGLACG